MDNPDVIGARLKRLRLALGYSQARPFCAFVGISDQAWNNYETGRRRISIDEAMKIIMKTGASLDWIYRGLDHTLPKHVADKLAALEKEEEAIRRAANE